MYANQCGRCVNRLLEVEAEKIKLEGDVETLHAYLDTILQHLKDADTKIVNLHKEIKQLWEALEEEQNQHWHNSQQEPEELPVEIINQSPLCVRPEDFEIDHEEVVEADITFDETSEETDD